ncbi:hypothetical protein ACRAWF_36880 [Streptomyces sp. L7]
MVVEVEGWSVATHAYRPAEARMTPSYRLVRPISPPAPASGAPRPLTSAPARRLLLRARAACRALLLPARPWRTPWPAARAAADRPPSRRSPSRLGAPAVARRRPPRLPTTSTPGTTPPPCCTARGGRARRALRGLRQDPPTGARPTKIDTAVPGIERLRPRPLPALPQRRARGRRDRARAAAGYRGVS